MESNENDTLLLSSMNYNIQSVSLEYKSSISLYKYIFQKDFVVFDHSNFKYLSEIVPINPTVVLTI